MDWAITKLKLGKAPGMSGLTAEFYKSFRDQLMPYLKELFDYFFRFGKIPATWKEARLTLILKERKNSSRSRIISPDCIIERGLQNLEQYIRGMFE